MIDPYKYYNNNVAGTLSLLEAMRSADVQNIVVSGTCAVYGQPEEVPISEKCPPNPINPYGRTKYIMEQILNDFAVAYNTNWVSLRYFNAAGCDTEAQTGERHYPETHLIPRVFMAAEGHIPALEIFGDNYPTKDGTCIRDYIHVLDLAEAHKNAMEYLLQGEKSQAFNLGTGTGFSVKEILNTAEKIIGKKIPHLYTARREGDPALLIANSALANKTLNWQCQYSDVDTVLATAYVWYCKDNKLNNLLQ